MALHVQLSDEATAIKASKVSLLTVLISTDEMYSEWIQRELFDIGLSISSSGLTLTVIGMGMMSGPIVLYRRAISFDAHDRDKALSELDDTANDLMNGTVLELIDGHIDTLVEYGEGIASGKIVDLRSVRIAKMMGTYR